MRFVVGVGLVGGGEKGAGVVGKQTRSRLYTGELIAYATTRDTKVRVSVIRDSTRQRTIKTTILSWVGEKG
jgi:hypothetical protein